MPHPACRRPRSLRRWSVAFSLLASLLALAGCASGASSSTQPPATSSGQVNVAPCGTTACANTHVRVFVEPDAGESPVLTAIRGAKNSIWLEIYLLTDTNVIHALEDAAQRHVQVRVLLETHPYGSGDVSPDETLSQLKAAGVDARPSNPVFRFTHEKGLLVDGATAYIMTCNFTKSALGGSAYAANREYGVIDTDANDVAQMTAIFQGDWNRVWPKLQPSALVISPINARQSLTTLINNAQRTLKLEEEEMYDPAIEDALIAAAKRGVQTQVVLPAAGSDTGAGDDARRLTAGGVAVRTIVAPYMHAKLIVADGALAFAGSENISGTSLDGNRELGLMVGDPTALATFGATFERDWALATPA